MIWSVLGRVGLVVLIAAATIAGLGFRFDDRAAERSARLVPRPDGPIAGHPRLFPAQIAFWDNRRGLALFASDRQWRENQPAIVGRTTDGGRTWKIVWRGPHVEPVVVARGTRSAWLVGRVLRRTTDGGTTWRVASKAPLFDVSFADARNGIGLAAKLLPQPIAFGAERIVVSSDGGRSWRRRRLPCSPRPTALIDQVSILTRRTAWVVCQLGTPGPWNRLQVFRTEDGGKYWRRLRPKPQWAHGASGLAFLSGRRGYYYDRYVAYRSDDGGRTWRGLPPFARDERECASLSFIGPERGLALMRDVQRPQNRLWLRLIRTEDGGRSWKRVASWRVHSWPLP
jgi:photosystem II stability/assembly factor-like uncharacterized protein